MDRKAKGTGLESIRLVGLDRYGYPLYREKVVTLYKHVFTTGEAAQKLSLSDAKMLIDAVMRYGFGMMAFDGQRLAGVVLAMPLKKHEEFPEMETIELDPRSTLYIAEVMVHDDYRNRGMGTMLLEEILERPAGFSSTLIRVWEENRPACNLYRKLGFRPIAAISQTKRRPDGEHFEMRKLYFLK